MRTWARGEKIAAAGLMVAVITAVATITVPEIRCRVGLEECSPQSLYVGRVLDQEQQVPVGGAKVTLLTQDTPVTVYTDTEGVYQFSIDPKQFTGVVRVEANGYKPYERRVYVDNKQIEDIRLVKTSRSSESSTSSDPTEDLSVGKLNDSSFNRLVNDCKSIPDADSQAAESVYGYSLIHLTNDIILSVEQRDNARLFVGAYGKANSNFKEIEMELPAYLHVSSGWQRIKYEDGIYGIWTGCYPRFCQNQKGAAIFDCTTNQFYRIQFVKASSRDDREEERNTLDGESLPDSVNYVNFPIGSPPDKLLANALPMLSLEEAEIVEGRLCSSLYCDGGNQPPDSRNSTSLSDRVNRSLKSYGLAQQMPYSQARRILIQRDWQPQKVDYQFGDFPEISCGNAICSASLRKGNRRLDISLNHDLEVKSISEGFFSSN